MLDLEVLAGKVAGNSDGAAVLKQRGELLTHRDEISMARDIACELQRPCSQKFWWQQDRFFLPNYAIFAGLLRLKAKETRRGDAYIFPDHGELENEVIKRLSGDPSCAELSQIVSSVIRRHHKFEPGHKSPNEVALVEDAFLYRNAWLVGTIENLARHVVRHGKSTPEAIQRIKIGKKHLKLFSQTATDFKPEVVWDKIMEVLSQFETKYGIPQDHRITPYTSSVLSGDLVAA